MFKLLLYFLLLTIPNNIKGQSDTVHSTLKSTWTRLYNSDQGNRGTNSNDSIDSANLFKVCQLIEKYGYPTKKEFGKAADVAWLVWIHCPTYAQKQATFGIINQAFESKEILKYSYHHYFLAALFQNKFGFAPKRTKPTEENIEARLDLLGMDKSTELDLEKIKLVCSKKLLVHKESEKTFLGKWVMITERYSHMTIGHPFQIYEYEGKYYYTDKHEGYDPKVLLLQGHTKESSIFKFQNNHDDECLRIDSTGKLEMLDKEGEILVEFLIPKQNK